MMEAVTLLFGFYLLYKVMTNSKDITPALGAFTIVLWLVIAVSVAVTTGSRILFLLPFFCCILVAVMVLNRYIPSTMHI